MEDKAVVRITSLEELAQHAGQTRELKFKINEDDPGEVIVKIRRLTEVESDEIDGIEEPLAPAKKQQGKQFERLGLIERDEQDPAYKKEKARVFEIKRAMILSKGLVDFTIPGETIEEKATALHAALPPKILNFLLTKIQSLTSGPIERAVFI